MSLESAALARVKPSATLAADAREAEQLIHADPFYAQGIFVSWVLRPWNCVNTNRELLPENPPA